MRKFRDIKEGAGEKGWERERERVMPKWRKKWNKHERDSILNSKIVHRNNNKNVTDVSDERMHREREKPHTHIE